MADPTKYQRGYSFSGYQATNPKQPLPASRIDDELEAIEASIDDLADSVRDVRRSDGALVNEIVTFDSLHPDVRIGVGEGAREARDTAVAAAAEALASAGQAEGSADVAGTAKEAAEAARDTAVAAATAGTALRDTRALAAAAQIPTVATYLRTAGYATVGDDGGALYKKLGSAPGTPSAWHFQSADGAWWQAVAREWAPEMFGGNLQAAIDAAYTLGGVVVLKGTVTVVSVDMRPGVRVLGFGAASVIRRSVTGATGYLVNFQTYSAHGASLESLTVDGNRGATYNPAGINVLIGTANDVSILRCTIKDAAGTGVYATDGVRFKINHNTVSNCGTYAVGAVGTGFQSDSFGEIIGNHITQIGMHAIAVTRHGRVKVRDNKILGHLVYGMHVSIAGTAATWVSGPKFTGALAGNFLIANGGTELSIAAVLSDTQLTLSTSGAATNVWAAIGPGDQIGMVSSPHSEMIDNYITGGAGCGTVVGDDSTNYTDGLKMHGNTAIGVGSSGFSVQSSGKVRGTSIIGNTSKVCGRNGLAGHVEYNNGITIAGVCTDTFLDGNINLDLDQGTPTMQYGINISGPSLGEVRLGRNVSVNHALGPVGGAGTITLSAGWGVAASVANFVSDGDNIRFRITGGASGFTANPTINVNAYAIGMSSPPQPMADVAVAATGGVLRPYVTASVKTGFTLAVNGLTPVAGGIYEITVKL